MRMARFVGRLPFSKATGCGACSVRRLLEFRRRAKVSLVTDASYLNATAKKRNAEAMGKKYGVDVKDPVALKKKLAEINALRERSFLNKPRRAKTHLQG